jgi:hypothetical protein
MDASGTDAGEAADHSPTLPSATPGIALGGEADAAVMPTTHLNVPDRMARAHAARQVLIQKLFQILDRDDDGVLTVDELFVLALAVAHVIPQISLPPLVDSSASPRWVELCRELAAGHAAPANGFDRAAFGRLVTLGQDENVGGMALSSRALKDIISYLVATATPHGVSPTAVAPPPVVSPNSEGEAAPSSGEPSSSLVPPGPSSYTTPPASSEPPSADAELPTQVAQPPGNAEPALVPPGPLVHATVATEAAAPPALAAPPYYSRVRFSGSHWVRWDTYKP